MLELQFANTDYLYDEYFFEDKVTMPFISINWLLFVSEKGYLTL